MFSCKGKKETVAKQATKENPVEQTTDDKDLTFGYLYFNGCNERMKGNLQQALKIFEECKKFYPDNAAASYELGTIHKLLGNKELALANAKFCAGAEPKNEWYQLLLIDCFNENRQYKQAIKVREDLVKNFPAKSEFKEDLAIEYAVTGQYDKSLKIYEQLEKNYGVNEQLTLNKVKLLKSQHKPAAVEQELLKLSDTDKGESRYYSYLAEFYLEHNQLEKAKAMYDKILQIDPNNAGVNLALHDYYSSKGMDSEAYSYLKKAFENPELDINTKANILGEYYRNAEKGNTKAAERGTELAKIAIGAHPKATESNAIYADFLRLAGKTKEASTYYYLAAVSEKRNYSIWKNLLLVDSELSLFDSLEHHSTIYTELFPTLPNGYLFNGLANSQLHNYGKAVRSLKDGQGYTAGNRGYTLDFLRALGDAYFYLKEYQSSDKSFDEALKIDPDNTYVLNNYAYYLSLRNESLEKAEKYSKRTNDLVPNNRSYMDTYGWILYMQKKYAEAEPWLSKAARIGASDPTILEHYGDLLYRLDKPAEALEQWKAAKAAGGNSAGLNKKIKEKKLDD